MKHTNLGVYTYNGENIEYYYSLFATCSEQMTFVDTVTSVVVTKNAFMPLVRDIAFNFTLVNMFTDIDDNNFKNDDGNIDIDIFENFDKQTGVSDFLKSVIDEKIIASLNDSIDSNIAYKTGIHKDSISTAIVNLIKTLEKKMSQLGGDVDIAKVNNFIQKFNSSGLNAESIVKTYLDSDTYKKNVDDVIGAKNNEIQELRDKLNNITARNVMADKEWNQ